MDPEVSLIGASGGVYALLAAHLANVIINYHQMRYSIFRLALIFLIGKCYLQSIYYLLLLDRTIGHDRNYCCCSI